MIKPVLRGKHRSTAGGGAVWEGEWCMREVDFEDENLRAPFFYERGEDGTYTGWFEIKSAAGSNRYTEKCVEIKFGEAGADKVAQVSGAGANKLGKFTLTGTLNVETGMMSVVREYAARKIKRNMVSQARVARELDLLDSVETPNGQDQAPVAAMGGSSNVNLVLSKMGEILAEVMEEDEKRWFWQPVDAERLGLFDYHTIIKKPMDLGTVKKKFDENHYLTPQEMYDDIALVFGNAVHYNPRGSLVYKAAAKLQGVLDTKYDQLMKNPIASEISTPAARAPTIRKIGKRHSIPKIVFEPEDDLGDQTQGLTRKRKFSSEVEPGAAGPSSSSELEKLREQVKQMSQNLELLNRSMSFSSAASSSSAGPASAKQPRREASSEVKRRLGRDIQFLDAERLARIVEIINENGFTLPINDITGEFELDIDMLDYNTIQKLRKYVSRHLSN